MTRYTVWLYPGYGIELKPFSVEAFSEQDMLEEVGKELRHSAFTIEADEFDRLLQEYADDYGDRAYDILLDTWYPVNGGEFYLYIENARIDAVPGTGR